MIAQKLYDAGFTDLVSVMPPDAVLASNSRVKPEARGKVPGLLSSNGVQWYGYAFTKQTVSPETIDVSGANIGLLGDRFPGLDIDVDDEQLALAVATQALKFLGGGPVRRSTGFRVLIPYRTDEPFARMALKIKYKGVEHTVEVLGKGRQYLVSGTHPSGSQYHWDTVPLWEWNAGLGTINKEKVDAFFDHLVKVLGDRAECHKIGDGRTAAETAPPQEDLRAPSVYALKTVVAMIPNPAFWGWDEMIEFGYAVKAAGFDDEDQARECFFSWCDKWESEGNDPDTNTRNWDTFQPPFRVGWEYLQGLARDLTSYQPATDIFQVDPDAVSPPSDKYTIGARINLTDEWAVFQLLDDLREQLRYVTSTATWYVWDEYRWTAPKKGLEYEIIIRDRLTHLCLWLRDVADARPSDKEGRPFRAASIRLQNLRGIESVIRLARGLLSVPLSAFDKDRWALNTPGGVLNLRTGDMTSVRKEDLHSRATLVAPEKGRMPLFSKFMRDLTGNDTELIKFLQRYMGYCLTGDVSEKVLAFAWGSDSDTGKSTFVRVMSLLFGDYADSVDVEAFITARTGGRIPDDIARLPGARLVTATEPSAGQHWDEKTIKAITGGDEISARKLHQSWFTFKPQFKILVVGNVQPELRNVDSAMLRRVMIVPMNHAVAREDQIDDLSERIVEEEGPAILHWLVQGCLARASRGLDPPEAVRAQTDTYKDTQDILAQWISEQCELSGGDRKRGDTEFDTTRRDLYGVWRIWCKGGDHDYGTEKQFKMNMDARANRLGFKGAKVGPKDARKRGYRGIRIKDSVTGGFEK